MFITTANNLDTIPPALRDRMEVIEFSGYIEEEKFKIAKNFLVSKQLKEHGLDGKKLFIEELAIRKIIREYTREAGVRELERNIAAICRKVARKIAENNDKENYKINASDISKYLGPEKYHATIAEKKNEVGVVTGLAWTEVGGEILLIEATKMPGKGQLILTGHLGKVMQESAQAAYSYVKSNANKYNIEVETIKSQDMHLHVPAGATPKDGPSAGLAMATALISALTKRKVDRTVGMTGEINLRGKAMKIGGLKNKILAAHRAGLKTIIIPKSNKSDLEELPQNVKDDLKFVFAETMDDVIPVALK